MTHFSPYRATLLAIVLAFWVAGVLVYGAVHHRTQPSTSIGCALVLTRNGQECRP